MFGLLRTKTFWGGAAAIFAGLVHLIVEAKTRGVVPVVVGVVSGQYTETIAAIGTGFGLIGARHAIAKAGQNGNK